MNSNIRKYIWEDKEIKFDIEKLHETLCHGEVKICVIDNIEDSKGNPGNIGRILATNLRLIWYSSANKNLNLSIGYSAISKISMKTIFPRANRSPNQALYILAISSNKLEFLFHDVSGKSVEKNPIFRDIFEVHQLFQRTHLYRDVKLRGAILKSEGQLVLLPNEQIYNNFNGVWNLSCDQGNLGSFIVTNIRLVWFADANESFNISLPFIQIASIRIRDSKYGQALVVQTFAGNFVLGFRIDPNERLNVVYKELSALCVICNENPDFGIHYDLGKLNELTIEKIFNIDQIQEIDEKQDNEISSKLHSYEIGNTDRIRHPVYSKKLGFAIEQMDGYQLEDLWEIMPNETNIDE